jgi:hypothetical protein
MMKLLGWIPHRRGAVIVRASVSAALPRSRARVLATAVLGGALVLGTAATGGAQEAQDGAFVASALGVPESSVQVEGPLDPVTATDSQLYRVGDEVANTSPGIVIEQGAYARLLPLSLGSFADLVADGAQLDCARSTVACPTYELRLERFDEGAGLFVWDLAGAVTRPTGDQILRLAVLAYDPRYPLLTDPRANSPFTRVNKIWVMDFTETAETMRYFQVDVDHLGEFRTDAIAGFNADRGYTLIANEALDGVTEWNFHTYTLGEDEEGGHSLVAPGDGLLPLTGTTIQIEPAPPEPCAPRPPVRLAVEPVGDGVLEVTVTAGEGALTGLEVGDGTNWAIEPPAPIQIPAGATEFTFRVRRTAPGAVSVPFTVTDGCGEWPTFVGGGASAF